jgi:sulfate transport system ATP-binding protein
MPTSTGSTAISVRDLDKRFGGFHAVKGVSFDVHEGELMSLLGPSGSGKSTILRMIAGLVLPDAGEVIIGGEDVTWTIPQVRNVGFVFQHYALFKHMTVFDNVAFGLTIRKRTRQETYDRVMQLLEIVQLGGKEGRYPHQLSGGERQRVALARALAPRPQVLLLDEPLGAVDAKVRIELRAWLRRLVDTLKITTIFVTHDQEEALELADRVIVMSQGRIEQIGTPQDIYDRPATPFVTGFIGEVNVVPGYARNGVAHVDDFEFEAQLGVEETPVLAMIRPSDVVVSAAGVGSNANARVRRISYLGWMAKLELVTDHGQRLVAHLPNDRLKGSGIEQGSPVHIEIRDPRIFAHEEEETATNAR